MTKEQFWLIIDGCRSQTNDIEEVTEKLRSRLNSMTRSEVSGFQEALNDVMVRAYSWDLIGAACFLGCGQSDDGFEDFRAWLVALGQDTFESVLQDVNLLAQIPFHESPTEEWYCEEFHYLPSEIGGEDDDPDWPYRRDPETPHGTEIALTKAALRDRFPQLWNRFGDRFMIGIR